MGDDAMRCDLGGCGHDVAFFRRYWHEGALHRDEVCVDHVTAEPANEEGEVYALVPVNLTGPRPRERETARWMLAWLTACAEFACPTEAHFRLLAWSHLGLPSEAIDALVREAGGGDSALAGPIPRVPTPWDADLLARSRDLLLMHPTVAIKLRAIVASGVATEDDYVRVLCDTLGLTRDDAERAAAQVKTVRRGETMHGEVLAQQAAGMDTTLGKMRSLLERLDAYFPTLPGRPLPTETFARLFVAVRDPRSSPSTTLSLLSRALREWVAFLPMHPNAYEAWLLREAQRDWSNAEEGKKAAEKLRRAAAQRVPTETAFRVVLTDCPWMSEEDIGIALANVAAQKGHGQKTPHDPLGAERRAWNEREQALLRDLQRARDTIRALEAKVEAKLTGPVPGLTAEQTEQVAAAFYNGLAHAEVKPISVAGPAWDKVLKSLQDLSTRDHVGLSLLVRDAILASQLTPTGAAMAHLLRTRAKSAALAAMQRTRLETCELGAAWDALLETLCAPTPAMPHDLADRITTMLLAVREADREQVAETLRSHAGAASLRRSPTLLEQAITVVTGKSLVQRVEAGILRQLAPASGAAGETEEAILDRLERYDYAAVIDALAGLVEREQVLRREDDGTYVLPPTNDRVRAEILRWCEAKPEPWVSIEGVRALVQVALGVRLSDRAFDFAYMPMLKAGTLREHREGPTVFVGLPARVNKAPLPKAAGEQEPAEESLAVIEARIEAVVDASAAPVSYTHLVAARAPGTTQHSMDKALARLVATGRLVRTLARGECHYLRPSRRLQDPPASPSPEPVVPKKPGPSFTPEQVEMAVLEHLQRGVHTRVALLPMRPVGASREDLSDALGRLVAKGKIRTFMREGVAHYEALPAPALESVPDAPPASNLAEGAYVPSRDRSPAGPPREGAYVPSRDRSPAGPPREGEEVSVAALADGEFVARVKLAHEGVVQPLTVWLGAGTNLVLTWGPLSIASGRWNPETATVVEWKLFPGNPLVPQGATTWDDTVNDAVLRLLAALKSHRPPRRWDEERAKGLLLVEAGRAMAQGSPRQAAAWQRAIASDESWQSEAGFSACFQRLGPTDTSLADALKLIYAA